jgi:hypothetical protein
MVAIEDSSTTEMSRIAAESATRDLQGKYHNSPGRGISGTAAKSSLVYSPSGRSRISLAGPNSVNHPARITAMCVAICATTGRLYLKDMPVLVFFDPEDISRKVAYCCTG